jgi:signal transduction histidine kinase
MRESRSGAIAHATTHLDALLGERRDEIVDRWQTRVRGQYRAQTMTAPVLIDHVPALLDDIAARAADLPHDGAAGSLHDETVCHALPRLGPGFDLEQVIQEYSELRTVILELLDTGGHVLYPGELVLVNRTLDLAIAQAVSTCAAAPQRVPRAGDRVSKATREREKLLTAVSDDLRHPLGAIMAGAGLLLRKSLDAGDDTTRRSLETVLRAASQLDRLIADLLDTARIQTGRLVLDCHQQPLAAIVADAQHLHHPLAVENGVRLTFEIELIDVECRCDRDRILQVLSNLLSNALKVCKSGDSIQVWATALDTQAIIEIADTGPGISPEDLPHIFEPGWSGRLGTNHRAGHALFISRGIVEAHGGQLWAHSDPGRGSTFRFTLPVTMSADASS